MANYALLNNVDHQDVKIITERSARYGDNQMLAPTFPFEFRNVQAFYPILFQQQTGGGFQPVALLGFEQGENLFLGPNGWQAAYVPAMLRREPFLIGFQRPTDAGDGEPVRVLSLDMDHPRVNTEAGEALFHPLGGRTEFVENTADLLERIYDGVAHGKAFVKALEEQALIEAVTLEIPLRDGSTNQLLGFHCLAEQNVQALSGEVLGQFQAQGFLLPLFMILASMGNIQRLVELKNNTVEAGDGLAG